MILDDLVSATSDRINLEMQQTPLATVKQAALKQPKTNAQDIYDRFLSTGVHVIGEVKKASPSKGIIVNDFPYLEIAEQYSAAGVTAISVLTEPDYFKGDLKYLQTITEHVDTPVLRKDFTIDPYMIYQAKASGAKIILLIVAILTPEQLSAYLKLAHQLGLAAIVEAHDEAEIKVALNAGAKMIGVNNRNLKNFTVSFENSIKLRPLVPKSVAFIAESGVKTVADVQKLAEIGVNGVLIGETLMRSNNKAAFIEAAQEID
ncbi:indole-3-glycerol phosphate synthase TrpC (plasmid) [Nicoliella spurrieriana]|uniref:Indole-3-glycerol phosphate synthase n=1 Tax=Nicoliella spurrieriana TaxID=2925830 RepID=A0A976RQG3_9LACO|nr:indole-3-glycerol phosphate synthase TrpC [Nicoliella spurrieriana]UQS86007.1 indole-3-glycerol phosphate synthase TrpC [Nicoliella spurrieriana]